MAGSTPKRYFWLKLQSTYFNQLEQKKMKKQEHGKDMQIVYLRMMLLSLDKGGYIYYQGVYDSLEEELSEEFDEPVEIIKETLDYLRENNMISIDENFDCFVPESLKLTGSESYSAERMRKKRQKEKMLHCDTDVTKSDIDVTACDEELEIEKEIKKEIDYQLIADMYNDTCVSFPKLTKLSDKRKKAVRARFKQGYSVQDFKRLFEMAEGSSFLKGGNNRNWSANFDWLTADANMAKVLDGNYQDRRNTGGGDTYGNGSQSRGQAADFYEQFMGPGDGGQD
jgi:phage replisome organizer, putative, N-terminal region